MTCAKENTPKRIHQREYTKEYTKSGQCFLALTKQSGPARDSTISGPAHRHLINIYNSVVQPEIVLSLVQPRQLREEATP